MSKSISISLKDMTPEELLKKGFITEEAYENIREQMKHRIISEEHDKRTAHLFDRETK